MKKIFIKIIVINLFLFNCTNASESDLIDEQPIATITTYNDIKSIINNNCINCHQSPPLNGANTSLLTYDNVKNAVLNNNLINRISSQAGSPDAMPFGGPRLPQNLIDQIIKWKDDGLIEN